VPKLKTHKGAKRRFQVTGSGKIMRKKQGASHLRRKKSQRTKYQYEQKLELHPADAQRIRQLITFYI
jgi:large subunit ribosomal protein L35